MKKKICYYAHPMLSYDSTVEEADVKLLESLGFEVINPNTQIHRVQLELYIAEYGKENVMDYFTAIVRKCDVLAFRTVPEAVIFSGVATEIKAAQEEGIPIIEIPSRLNMRMLNYPDTKEYLYETGFYKVKK